MGSGGRHGKGRTADAALYDAAEADGGYGVDAAAVNRIDDRRSRAAANKRAPPETWPETERVVFCVPGLSPVPSTLAVSVVWLRGASPVPAVDDTLSPPGERRNLPVDGTGARRCRVLDCRRQAKNSAARPCEEAVVACP